MRILTSLILLLISVSSFGQLSYYYNSDSSVITVVAGGGGETPNPPTGNGNALVSTDGQSNSGSVGMTLVENQLGYLTGTIANAYIHNGTDFEQYQWLENHRENQYYDYDNSRFGFNIALLYALTQYYDTVWLAASGRGATGLVGTESWHHPGNQGHERMVTTLQAAYADLEGHQYTHVIHAWNQGENEAADSAVAAIYDTALVYKIIAMRTDPRIPEFANVPWVITKLSSAIIATAYYMFPNVVNDSYDRVAVELDNVYTFSGESITFRADWVHYDAAGMVTVVDSITERVDKLYNIR